MAVFNVACPECKAVLKTSKPVPAGTAITCPKCQVMFAAPKAKAAVVKAAVSAGVELIEEDDDIIEDVEIVEAKAEKVMPNRKPDQPRAKRNKPQKKNTGLIIALCVGPVVLAAFGIGGYFMVSYLLKENLELVAYAPPKAPVVFGIDYSKLAGTPLGPIADKALASTPIGKYCEAAGTPIGSFLNKVVVGALPKPNGEPAASIAFQGRTPFDKAKLVTAFGGTAVEFGGRKVQQMPATNSNIYLLTGTRMATIVIGPTFEAEDVVRSAGRASIDPGLTDFAARASKADFWAVVNPQATGIAQQMNQFAKQVPGLPKNAEESMGSINSVGIWANWGATEIEVTIEVKAADKTMADTINAGFKKSAEPGAPGGLDAATVVQKDNTVTMTGKVKTSTVTAFIQAASFASMFGPQQPQGGGRGPRGR